MSQQPPPKRARHGAGAGDWLPELLHLGGVSNAALAAILKKVESALRLHLLPSRVRSERASALLNLGMGR